MADLDAAVRISGRVDPSFERAFRRGETTVKGLDSRLDGLGIPRSLADGTERASRGFDRLDQSGRRAGRGVRSARDGIRGLDRQARRASDGVGRLERRLGGLRGGGLTGGGLTGGGLTGAGAGIAGGLLGRVGPLFGIAGAAGGIAATAGAAMRAMDLDELEIRLRPVLAGDGTREDRALQAREEATRIARQSLASDSELLRSMYEAGSAGLTAAAVPAAAEVAHRVATVTRGESAAVTQTLARAFRQFGAQFGAGVTAAADAEALAEIGAVLTAVQQAEQISDFASLNEGLKGSAAEAVATQAEFRELVAVIGKLNSAGLTGSVGGTAMAAFLRALPKAMEKLNLSVERSEDGTLKITENIDRIRAAVSHLDTDARKVRLAEVMDSEALKVVSLLSGMTSATRDLAEATRSARESMERDYRDLEQSAKGAAERVKQNWGSLRAAAGRLALPTIAERSDEAAAWLATRADELEGTPDAIARFRRQGITVTPEPPTRSLSDLAAEAGQIENFGRAAEAVYRVLAGVGPDLHDVVIRAGAVGPGAAPPVVVEPLVIERGAIQITGAPAPRQTAEEVIRLIEERARQRTAASEWDER